MSSTPTIVSELKMWLVIDKCLVYDDCANLLDNLRYPLLLKDRLSAEIPFDQSLNRSLIDVEDMSDSNLDIQFVHEVQPAGRLAVEYILLEDIFL